MSSFAISIGFATTINLTTCCRLKIFLVFNLDLAVFLPQSMWWQHCQPRHFEWTPWFSYGLISCPYEIHSWRIEWCYFNVYAHTFSRHTMQWYLVKRELGPECLSYSMNCTGLFFSSYHCWSNISNYTSCVNNENQQRKALTLIF